MHGARMNAMTGPRPGSTWFDVGPVDGARPRFRLFCFPHAGGSAWIFRSWASRLPPCIEVCPVHLPGRGQRIKETLLTALDRLVGRAIEDFAAHCHTPFAFFGHSMGALLAFELARELHRRFHVQPVHLFVAARPAPHLPPKGPPTYDLPDAEFAAVVRDLQGTSADLLDNPEAWALVMPILRADFQVVQTYRYRGGPALTCPISVIGGERDPFVTSEGLTAWREVVAGPLQVDLVPGNHFFVDPPPPELLTIVTQRLAPNLTLPPRP